ncbi:MAG TPA: protoporphyrinogen oxidase, partial [Candidatus Saccharimonadales bacterium]|nr:protoporphyrinogen oxidase [Candidatus Saccharimonadales bacterium]
AAGCGVRALARREGGWTLHLQEGGSWEADACVVAIPAAAAAEILGGVDPELPGILEQVRYASSAVVFLGYREGPGARLPGATGFLVASDERRSFFGCTFVSNKFDERAPEGTVLVRTFIGGALDEERASLADGPLVDAVRKDLAEIVGLRADPILVHVQRWPKTNPQHEVGHAEKVAAVDRRLASLPGLFVTGSALRGIGIPDGVVMGRDAAGGILRFLDLDGDTPGERLSGDLPTEGAP